MSNYVNLESRSSAKSAKTEEVSATELSVAIGGEEEVVNLEEKSKLEIISKRLVADPTQNRTIGNIRKALNETLEMKYGIEDKNSTDTLLRIHGLHEDNFDFVGISEKIIRARLNDVSIDDNANKNEKSIKSLLSEVSASTEKAIGFDFLYQVMRELYGKAEAKRLSGEMYDYSLGISDSTKILLPYCWAFDASKIVLFGRPFGQLRSMPPKRLESYIGALNETIHQMTSHLAGAIAVGSFFMDFAHILIYKEKVDLNQLRSDNALRKRIENNFQSFVHSVNHLSRNGIESPFTNISIFDRSKLRSFLGKDNMHWYFEGLYDAQTDTYNEEYFNYVVDYIMELQMVFLDYFDQGDPASDGMPYRFPVVTINISKTKKADGKYDVADDAFLKKVISYDIHRYNLFSSEGTKVASCCRLINDTEMLDMASSVNSFGGSGLSLGSHRVVTINFNRIALETKSYEEYFEILDKRTEDVAKIMKAHKELIKMTNNKGLQLFIKIGWITLNKLFSTFGVLGEVEAVDTLRARFNIDKDTDIMKDILKFFNAKVADYSKQYGIIGNIEQIPGESMAVRFVKADKILFGSRNVPYTLYSNQFIPLWKDATFWERIELDGKYNQLITGGGIVHFTIGEKVTSKQAEKIIRYAIESGCEHFALNAIYTECQNGHNHLGKYEKCPSCGADARDYYTRIVGYFVPVSSWSKERREGDFEKRVIKNL